jgi:heme/copper-type cytochrome/quinol oxidase subunit 1
MDKRVFLDCTGGILIVLCVVGLIGAFVFAGYLYSTSKVQDVNVQIVMNVDSTGVLSEESKQQVIEMKEEIIRHEHLLEDRYKHVLEQKENLNDMLTIGGMFMTIVLALFGFFGYKSMTTLEDKVKENAKTTAEETATKASKEKFENFEKQTKENLTLSMGQRVKETVDKEMAEFKMTAKKQISDNINEQVQEVKQKAKDYEELISGLTTSLENLDNKLSKFDERVVELEKGGIQPRTGRRTLANGGKKA